ncbi:putative cell cycle control protein [Talaromyces proteolyticus]|uniref:Cell cycle control protein n=1 Tax=Talaromyces proteolyticus TaxID=1131652 RepID=A0AAD4PW82_9EURO|nr:putative cell cycle control protein [Talaromyces proteolyticus]KAH8697560.1 putative cell cycle control protein [Talaromyces proteolyticus]
MTLEDFEKSLAESRSQRHSESHTDKDRSRHHRHRHHHHHHSSSVSRERRHDRDRHREDSNGHRHKRSRRDDNGEERESIHKRRHRQDSIHDRDLPNIDADDTSTKNIESSLKRDSWMEAPSSLDVDYVQRPSKRPEADPEPKMLKADFDLKIHKKELNEHLRDLRDGKVTEQVETEPAQHEVDYTFGDAGSQWRMTKLRAVYREAEESSRKVEEVAIERFGDLRSFDDAREEEIEMDRRERYGESYVGKIKPSGELFQERKLDQGVHRSLEPQKYQLAESGSQEQGKSLDTVHPTGATQHLDATALNRLRAKMMKAKLKGSSEAAELEEQYNTAAALMANRKEGDVVVLGVMENRMLAGGSRAEVKPVDNRRGRERGQVQENNDMSIEDMVREERRNRGQAGGEALRFAERIAKDAKFDNDLEYMDENASKLAKRVQKSELNLKNTAINEFQKMNRILDNCPLCHHEDTNTPPVAPVVSLATRTYLTLPTEPELSEGSATIVPIQHRTNLLECDDDEWEEIRNFMKSLTRMYHDQGRDVIFYENAAQPDRKRHAALEVVPLPYSLGETSPAFFREAILAADAEWTQHRKLIDTLAKSKQGLGKLAFRRTLVKEMPYFHVWFELDGGMGHVVEDTHRWPRGDLFARETLGGMLDLAPDIIKRQGKWSRSGDRRVEPFRKRWRKFDWTRILTEG